MSNAITSKQKETIFMNMSDGVLLINHNQEITYINPAAQAMLNLNSETPTMQDFLLNKKNKPFYKLLLQALKNKHKSDTAIISYENGEEKRVLNIRISQTGPEEISKETLKRASQKTSQGMMQSSPETQQEIPQGTSQGTPQGTPQGMMVLIEDVTSAHNLKKHERDCAMIFAGLITCICIYLFAWSLIQFTLGIKLKTSVYTLMIEGIAFLLFLEIIFFTSMTFKDIGIFVKPSKLFKTFLTSIPIAAVVCGVLALLNLLLRLTGHPIKPYFIGGSLSKAYTYIFTAILQEFLSRGVIQTSVKALMQIKYQKFFSIFLTSLLFALMHLPFDFPFMMGAFVLSIALGIVYEKQENIWGCAFLHWSCGYLAMAMFF